MPLPQGLLLDLIRPQLPYSLDVVNGAGLFSITWVLIWPVIIIRGHIPGSWSKREVYFCLQLRSHLLLSVSCFSKAQSGSFLCRSLTKQL